MARRMASLLLRLGEGVGEGFFTQKVPGSTDATARAAGVRVLMGGFISVCAGTASKNAGAPGEAAQLARDGAAPGLRAKQGRGQTRAPRLARAARAQAAGGAPGSRSAGFTLRPRLTCRGPMSQ